MEREKKEQLDVCVCERTYMFCLCVCAFNCLQRRSVHWKRIDLSRVIDFHRAFVTERYCVVQAPLPCILFYFISFQTDINTVTYGQCVGTTIEFQADTSQV